MAKRMSKSARLVASKMREVHTNEPSTVTRAKHFGPGGKEAMLQAIALNKARKAGARIPYKGRPHGSAPYSDSELGQGYRLLGQVTLGSRRG